MHGAMELKQLAVHDATKLPWRRADRIRPGLQGA
jgi:hypothetical protein